MDTDPFNLTPDPKFIGLLSVYFPHEYSKSTRLPNGNIRDEVLQGLNFMEDQLRIHQRPVDTANIFNALFTVERSMWTQPFVEEVRMFLKTNDLDPDLLANIWLLRCRIYFMLRDAEYAERNRHTFDSERVKNKNFAKNKILPFIKQIQGDMWISAKKGNVHSVSFKSFKPGGTKTLKLEGHLASNMYTALQEMAYKFLEANEEFNPDMLTNRLKTAVGEAARGAYQILRQWKTFAPTQKKTPPIEQLRVLKNLIELAASQEGMLDAAYENSKPEEQLRKFFK